MKVPEPIKLPSGAWRIQLRLGGESISITRAKKEDCMNAALKAKTKYITEQKRQKKRIVPDTKKLTLKAVQESYIKANTPVLSPATVRSYTSYAKNRWTKYQGKQISGIDWQQMINDELESVSEKTVKNAWGLVRPALEAVGYPVPAVKLAAVPVNEIAFLQPDEIKPFLKAVEGRSYEIPALLLLHGLRLSEVLGLQWEQVNLKTGTITVKGAVVRGTSGLIRKKQNKNQTSARTVPILIPRLLSLLKARRDVSGPVVVINPSNLLDDVKRASERAGGTIVTCHGLRHSFASLCYYLEIPERQIQEWGGWKDRTTLHRIYIRLTAAGESEARSKVTAFFTDDKKAKK